MTGSSSDPRARPPSAVAIAGDWHGNWKWGVHVIRLAAELLPRDGSPRIILQLGDFGFWHGEAGQMYLRLLDGALAEAGMELWWIDGNHEWHPGIGQLHAGCGDPPVPCDLGGSQAIWHLPRGFRWTWHGQTWLACGGAVSVDRRMRTEGRDWWPEERITAGQEQRIIADGHADVMLTHDCPDRWLPPLGLPALAWASELERAHAHSERLQRITDAVQPARIFHGHYHVRRDDSYRAPWGRCRVTGLNMDGGSDNWQLYRLPLKEEEG